jgi:hypothetical protein
MPNIKPDDPSHWLILWRDRQYLNRANKILHRSDGEQVLIDFIPMSTRRILDLGTDDGRLVKLLKQKILKHKVHCNRLFPSYAQDIKAAV